jgi:2-succinyl-6-hydroxy-2,4-cyclohexadiene-1-carboxylate synthase
VAQVVEYIEEPLQNPTIENLSEFYRKTKIHTALDESVDEKLFGVDGDLFFSFNKQTFGTVLNNSSNGANPKNADQKNDATATTTMALPEGVTTLILKPSTLGGFLPTLKLAQHARELSSFFKRKNGVQCVISSAFELPLGLSHLAHLAAAVDCLYYSCEEKGKIAKEQQYHGLGTGEWWDLRGQQPRDNAEKITLELCGRTAFSLDKLGELATSENPAVLDIHTIPLKLVNNSNNNSSSREISVETLTVDVATDAGDYSLKFLEARPSPLFTSTTTTSPTPPTIVFLHGFLGQPAEWLPFMKAFSAEGSYRCLALGLPGHASTISPKKNLVNGTKCSNKNDAYSLEHIATSLERALEKLGLNDCIVVGYSLGARLALVLSTFEGNNSHVNNSTSKIRKVKISKVVSISGSPGMPESDVTQREKRAEEDAERAGMLRGEGLDAFMSTWYAAPMWDTLTKQNTKVFHRIFQSRKRGLSSQNMERLSSLSLTLEKMSPGRAPDVQPDLYRLSSQGKLPKMLLIAGEEDPKFVGINKKLAEDLNIANNNNNNHHQENVQAIVVGKCGHTVHVEQPVVLLNILFEFINS